MYAPAPKTRCHLHTRSPSHSSENQSSPDTASTSLQKNPDKTPAPPAFPIRPSNLPSALSRSVLGSSENAPRDMESSLSRAHHHTARCSPNSPHTNRRSTASDAETSRR